MINIGVIGAGAVSSIYHCPVVHSSKKANLNYIYDINTHNMRELCDRFCVGYFDCDFTNKDLNLDAVIICTPHVYHYEIAKKALTNGLHVLCEKPLCSNSSETSDLINLAKRQDRVLFTSLPRRFLRSYSYLRDAINLNFFGPLQKIWVGEGGSFSWPVKSNYRFDKKKAGGGNLVSTGYHLIDAIFWMVDGRAELTSYNDNNQGGVETELNLDFVMHTVKYQIPCTVEVTSLRPLCNEFIFMFEHVKLHLPIFEGSQIYLTSNQNNRQKFYPDSNIGSLHQTPPELFSCQFEEFVSLINQNKRFVSEEQISIQTLIDSAYSSKNNT